MLKRQRPPSPPSSVHDVPLLPDSSLMHLAYRDSKRRRTLPPVLDGPSRGWPMREDEDNDEDDDDSDSLQERDGENTSESRQDSGEYKSANSVLHEVHALHQHRLSSSSSSLSHAHLLLRQPRRPYPQGVALPHQQLNSTLDKSAVPPLSEHQRAPTKDPIHSSVPELWNIGNTISTDEVLRVRERYEDANKLLGSLFLSRRRELGSIDEHTGSRLTGYQTPPPSH